MNSGARRPLSGHLAPRPPQDSQCICEASPPVCLRMWTTSMYWALKGFCSSNSRATGTQTPSSLHGCGHYLYAGFGGKIEKSNGNIQLFSAGGITEGPKPLSLSPKGSTVPFRMQMILFWLVHFLGQFALPNCRETL